jgi:hypothetical protein
VHRWFGDDGSEELTGWQARWRKIHPAGAPRWIMAVMTDQIEALLEDVEAADPGDAPDISDRLVDVLGEALDPDPDGAG